MAVDTTVEPPPTAAIGALGAPPAGEDSDELVRSSDLAPYRTKNAVRDYCTFLNENANHAGADARADPLRDLSRGEKDRKMNNFNLSPAAAGSMRALRDGRSTPPRCKSSAADLAP